MPVPNQDHYGFPSFPVDWYCLFIYLWVLTFPLEDCPGFGNFVITLIQTTSVRLMMRSCFAYVSKISHLFFIVCWPWGTRLFSLSAIMWVKCHTSSSLTVLSMATMYQTVLVVSYHVRKMPALFFPVWPMATRLFSLLDLMPLYVLCIIDITIQSG